jgi:hypothetical protein
LASARANHAAKPAASVGLKTLSVIVLARVSTSR